MDAKAFLAERVRHIGSSGIRRVFELGAALKDPINLSIGQPDFDVPLAAKEALKAAVDDGRNGYTLTRGLPQLRERIGRQLKEDFDWEPDVFVTCGVSGGLMLVLMACLNPGDEVLIPDPHFVSYPYLVELSNGKPVRVPLYPDFRLHAERLEKAITPRTKILLYSSPANPTGVAYTDEELRTMASIARKHNLLIASDEIYSVLTFDGPRLSIARHAPERTVILGGFGKTYGMTGWRMGFAAGPTEIISEMAKLQQYTFVCAPQPAQHGTIAAMDVDMSGKVLEYAAKRDLVCDELEGVFEFVRPGGGFYVFPKAPASFENATTFVDEAIRRNVLIIPGNAFSERDTHFRISYAAPNEKIREGCRILRSIAGQ